MARQTGLCSPKKPSSFWKKTRLRSSLVAGPQSVASPCFQSSKRTMKCSAIPCSMKGRNCPKTIWYTAKAVNQQATPAVDYLLAQGKKKFYLIGTDYVYPQTTNLILYKYLLLHGIKLEDIGGGLRKDDSGKVISAGKYTPFGHTDYQQIVAEIKQFAAGGDACVVNTINGDSNVPFFKEVAAAGLTPADCPVVSFSLAEDELRALPTKDLVGELGCWTYFMSLNTPENKKFLERWNSWLKKQNHPG